MAKILIITLPLKSFWEERHPLFWPVCRFPPNTTSFHLHVLQKNTRLHDEMSWVKIAQIFFLQMMVPFFSLGWRKIVQLKIIPDLLFLKVNLLEAADWNSIWFQISESHFVYVSKYTINICIYSGINPRSIHIYGIRSHLGLHRVHYHGINKISSMNGDIALLNTWFKPSVLIIINHH